MQRFGPYTLIRPLAPLGAWERWIALHELNDTDHVVYRHAALHDAGERRRLVDQVARLSRPKHPHLLPVEAYSFDEQGRMCLVAPYTGNQEGLVTVANLLARKNGRLEVPEVARVVEHLLDAIATARAHGLSGARIDSARVLIDRRGSVQYELFGLLGREGVSTPESEDIRAVAMLAAWLLTGVEPHIATVSVSRVAGRASRGWDAWITAAGDPLDGFETIAEALAAMPTRGGVLPAKAVAMPAERSPGAIGAVIRRFRRAAPAEARPSDDRTD